MSDYKDNHVEYPSDQNPRGPSPRVSSRGIGIQVRRLLDELADLDRREDLPDEARAAQRRQLASRILDTPEVSERLRKAYLMMEQRARLSSEVRDEVRRRIEDALLRMPEAATESGRLNGLIEKATGFAVSDDLRTRFNRDGTQRNHPKGAQSIDQRLGGSGSDGLDLHEVLSSADPFDPESQAIAREDLAEIIKQAGVTGERGLRMVGARMSGQRNREIAESEAMTPAAVAKFFQRFKERLEKMEQFSERYGDRWV